MAGILKNIHRHIIDFHQRTHMYTATKFPPDVFAFKQNHQIYLVMDDFAHVKVMKVNHKLA